MIIPMMNPVKANRITVITAIAPTIIIVEVTGLVFPEPVVEEVVLRSKVAVVVDVRGLVFGSV